MHADECTGQMHTHTPTLFAFLAGEGPKNFSIYSTEQQLNFMQPLP